MKINIKSFNILPLTTSALAAILFLAVLATGLAQAQTYDAAADFETGWTAQTNPNGVWSYGYSSGFTNPVTLYDQTAQPGINGPNAQYWLSSEVNIGESPSAEFNNGPAYDDGNVDFLADEFLLVAGIGGQYSDLVFTAPADGTYSVTGSFRGAQFGIGTLVGIVANGDVIFSSSVTAVGQTVPFDTELSLSTGDTVVFSVGPGGGLQNTGLSATITLSVPSLGSADQFGLLSIDGAVKFNLVSQLDAAYVSTTPSCPGSPGCVPDTGAVNIGLSADDYLDGDAIASLDKGPAIVMGPINSVVGECVTGGGGVLLGALSDCDGRIDESGDNSKVTTVLPAADNDVETFSKTAAALTATQTLPAIYLNSGQSYTITAAGLNIIDLPSIITMGSNTITIDGSPAATVVLNIGSSGTPGQLVLGPGTQIVLTGGITPSQIIFNVVGNGSPVTVDRYSTVNGTIMAPDDAINVSMELGANYANYKDWTYINGALIAGKDISIGCLVKIYFYPFGPGSGSSAAAD